MNTDIADIISQMDDRDFYQFLGTDFKDLTGVEFLGQQLKNQPTSQLKQRAIKAIQLAQEPEERKLAVVGAYLRPGMKLSSAEVQQTRTANAGDYTKFADDSYTAGDNDYADFDSYDDNVSSRRLQPNATKPQSTSQVTLDLVGIQNALAQDPNWQPRDDYEKWVVGQLQGAEWTPNPTVTAANVNRTAGASTPKAQNEKYQFNVLEDRKNRIAKVQNIPIPKPVGIRTDLQTGLVYDYNQGLVYNPATGITQKILSKGLFPTLRTIPDVIQGEQSNFIPFINTGDRGLDRQQQQDAVNNQLTDGENRFFGTASYSRKRDNSVPYKRAMGVAPRVAGIGQEYSPEVMSRVGQNGFLNNAGSIILPQTWIDKETNERVFSKGRGIATTIIYQNDGKGGVIPMLSIPRADGIGNDLIKLNDAVTRSIISPVDGKRIIGSNDGQEILSPVQNKTIGSQNLITLGQLKSAKDIASQTKFIPASEINSFNRDNVKLYETTDNQGKNYRATYMNPLTKKVYNVTQNGGFYLVRPAVSKEGSGLPTYDDTTNLAQEMTDINRAMREGGRDNLVDVIRENPDNPGLEAFTRPLPAINPITGETINKYVHSELVEKFNPATGQIEKTYVDTRTPNRWVDEDNPQELFNYFNANQESQGASMEALDLARGGSRTAGVKKAPFMDTYNDSITSTPVFDYYNEDKDRTVRDVPEFKGYQDSRQQTNIQHELRYDKNGVLYLGKDVVAPKQETTIFNSGNPITVSAPTGYQNTNATSAYPSLQETDYLAGRLAFNASGNIVDVPSQQLAAKGINNFTPASEFYSQTPQTIRDWRTGELLDTSNRSYGNDVLRFPTNPETPLRAYKVNEFGTVETNDGIPLEALTPNRGFGLPLPRSAQIANFQRGEDMRGAEAYPILRKDVNGNIQFVESPVRSGRKISLAPEDWEGVLPDSKSVPEGMSYDEAKDKGLLNPVWDKSRPFTALDGSYQIPLPKGVGLARVLDESDPRTQAALAAQAEAEARITGETTIVKPVFDRKYSITPSRTAGIESPQYAQYTDLKTSSEDDTRRFWKEDIDGIVPQGVIDGAYLPVTVTPRTTLAGGKQGFLKADKIYTTESGRKVQGKNANTFAYVPLSLDNVSTSYLPKSKREELELKGFSDDDIDNWVKANPNLARDNALANAKIMIDGQYYDVTPQATVAEFNPAAGGNYAMAETRSQHRSARIDLPFKAGTNISEPTPEWIQQQAVSGNLNFNPDDYISPDDKAILNQEEVYNAGHEEPTDILGAINRTQQKKNRIDAVISNREQRSVPGIQQLSADELRQKSQELDVAIDYAMQTNQKGLGLKLAGQKAQLDLLANSSQQSAMDNLNGKVGSVVDGNYTALTPGMKVFNQDMLANPTDLSTPISEDFVGPVQLVPDAQSPARKTFKGWKNYSNYLADEINTASKAHNTIVNIEDSPEVVVSREGTFNQLLDFNERGQEELGLNKYAGDISQQVVGYDKFDRPLYKHSLYGTLPDLLLPYEQAKELNQSRLLPAYRTRQKVKLPTVPTSNVVNLGRVKVPFPEEVVTTAQFVPAGNQVVPLNNQSVSDIVPSSSWQSTNQEIVENPRMRRRNQTPGVANSVFSMGGNTPNIPLEPDVRMTGGMSIPKWAIPATLGAVWLGLAANARRQQDEERRQQQGVVNRY